MGAKVNMRHGDEATPLMGYAESGSGDLVQELVRHHANVDLQDKVEHYHGIDAFVDD